MYTEILRSIEGIGIFPVFSLILFVTVFTVVVVRVVRIDRDRIDRHAALPLGDVGVMTGPHEGASDVVDGRRA